MINIDSNKAMPISKSKKRRQGQYDKAFREYSDAYAAVFVSRPSSYNTLPNGMIAPVMSKQQQQGMSVARMKELTRTYKQRALSR